MKVTGVLNHLSCDRIHERELRIPPVLSITSRILFKESSNLRENECWMNRNDEVLKEVLGIWTFCRKCSSQGYTQFKLSWLKRDSMTNITIAASVIWYRNHNFSGLNLKQSWNVTETAEMKWSEWKQTTAIVQWICFILNSTSNSTNQCWSCWKNVFNQMRYIMFCETFSWDVKCQ
jgi:hypothetical protein